MRVDKDGRTVFVDTVPAQSRFILRALSPHSDNRDRIEPVGFPGVCICATSSTAVGLVHNAEGARTHWRLHHIDALFTIESAAYPGHFWRADGATLELSSKPTRAIVARF